VHYKSPFQYPLCDDPLKECILFNELGYSLIMIRQMNNNVAIVKSTNDLNSIYNNIVKKIKI
jgi:hypothetical protein